MTIINSNVHGIYPNPFGVESESNIFDLDLEIHSIPTSIQLKDESSNNTCGSCGCTASGCSCVTCREDCR